MFIHEMFQQKPCVFSVEVFPPKKAGAAEETLYPVLRELCTLGPDYISVTYGAGGGTAGQSTAKIASYIKNGLHVEALAHLTCVNSTRVQVEETLTRLREDNVENVLALRGDINPDLPRRMDFLHASDLAKAIAQTGGFGVAGACYPEGHLESPSLKADVESLRYKAEAGVSHLITQLFFDNVSYYRFLNMARKAGISLPVQAGIMPIVSKRQIERTVALSSASLPPQFTKMISRYDHDEQALFDAGIEYAATQIRDLITGGADGIHLYAMNNARVARLVYEGIRDLLPERT